MSNGNENNGWGNAPWGTSPWGGFTPVGTPDINWSFERPDTEDPPGADMWTWSALDVGFWTALFGDEHEFESWVVSGFKFFLGSSVMVADFTIPDGPTTWEESFEQAWMGNTDFDFTIPDGSPVAELNGTLRFEDMEGWMDGDDMFWKVFRSSFQPSVYSRNFDGQSVAIPGRTFLTMGKVDVTVADRPVWEKMTIEFTSGLCSSTDVKHFLEAWFGSDSFFTGITVAVVNERVVISYPSTPNTVFRLFGPGEVDKFDGWDILGFPIEGLSRVNAWVEHDVGYFGNWVSPVPNPMVVESFEEDWGASDERWMDLPDGYEWEWENVDYQTTFGSGHPCGIVGFEETFRSDCWPDAPDPIVTT